MRSDCIVSKTTHLKKAFLLALPVLVLAGCDSGTKAIKAETNQIKDQMIQNYGKGEQPRVPELFGAANHSSQISVEEHPGKSVDGTTPALNVSPFVDNDPYIYQQTFAFDPTASKVVLINCDPKDVQLDPSETTQVESLNEVNGKISIPTDPQLDPDNITGTVRMIQAAHIYLCGQIQFTNTNHYGILLSAKKITMQNAQLALPYTGDISGVSLRTEQLNLVGKNSIQQTPYTENIFATTDDSVALDEVANLELSAETVSGNGHLSISFTGVNKIAQ